MVQYLRLPRLIFFHLTSALSITVVGLTSWGLKTLSDNRHEVTTAIPGAELHAGDVVAVGAALVTSTGIASLACTVMVTLLLFRPGHGESPGSLFAKEAVFLFAVIAELASLIGATYVCAQKSARVTSTKLPQALVDQFVAVSGKSLAYKDNRPVISYVIVGWFCWLSTLISAILVSMAARHLLKHGPAPGSQAAVDTERFNPGHLVPQPTGHMSEKDKEARGEFVEHA